MVWKRVGYVGVLLCALLVWSREGYCTNLQKAQQLFLAGSQLARKEQHRAAIQKFRQSLRALPKRQNTKMRWIRNTLWYLIGLSLEKLGKFRQAYKEYRRVQQSALQQKLKNHVKQALARIEKELQATLELQLKPKDAYVQVTDGEGRLVQRRGSGKLKVMAGSQVKLLLTRAKYQKVKRVLSLQPGQELFLSIQMTPLYTDHERYLTVDTTADKGQSTQQDTNTGSRGRRVAVVRRPPLPPNEGMSPLRVAGIVVGAVGLALVGAGVVTGSLAFATKNQRDQLYQNLTKVGGSGKDTQQINDLQTSLQQYALLTNIFLPVGAAVAVAGLVLSLLPARSSPKKKSALLFAHPLQIPTNVF